MIDLSSILKNNPNRPVVIFPECTTTNARGVLPLSRSLLDVPSGTKIFPVSLRYTPADVVTPLPGSYISFLWNLLSKPTHCIRVRIAEFCVVSDGSGGSGTTVGIGSGSGSGNTNKNGLRRRVDEVEDVLPAEKALLDYIGESLARLGRVRRVGLGVQDKVEFIRMWTRTRRIW